MAKAKQAKAEKKAKKKASKQKKQSDGAAEGFDVVQA